MLHLGAKALLANIRLGWKGLPATNALTYFGLVIGDKRKKGFYNIDFWSKLNATRSKDIFFARKFEPIVNQVP